MTIKKVSKMITFEKEGMKEALGKISNLVSDYYSPHFYLGERFPVLLWHETGGLSFHGKDRNSIISLDNNLKVKKGVRLR